MLKDIWLPGPNYRARIHGISKWLPKNGRNLNLLEFGCGETTFSINMAKRGYNVTCVDLEETSLELQRKRMLSNNVNMNITRNISNLPSDFYDYICSFEVLEHIQNDIDIIDSFYKLLTPEGTLILTVPAMMKRWNRFDELCGHFRRYEKNEIIDKLSQCKFYVQEIICYGFPLINITRTIDNYIRKKDKILFNNEQRSKISGSGRFRKFTLIMYLTGIIGLPFIFAQRLFYKTNFGIGWCIKAKKNINTWNKEVL